MTLNVDRISTTHVGSLPRTAELIAANKARRFAADGFTFVPTAEHDALVAGAVADLVVHQRDVGITLPGDGEYGKAMSSAVDYGAWGLYAYQRASGLELLEQPQAPVRVTSSPGNVQLTDFFDRRDFQAFAEAYSDPDSGIAMGDEATGYPSCTGPLVYTGQEAVARDIAAFRSALTSAGVDQGFITSVSPGSASRIGNEYYATEEEHIWAWADVMREEYTAIIEAGLVLQIDDPSIAENWDQINPEPSIEDYQAFTRIRVEALNHALRGLPEERIRFHLCWGSWHGPHTTDLELPYVIDLMLEVNAGTYSFEAANARHEHEWKVWEDVSLPDGKAIAPGIVGHATNVVEHPELVAERIERFASVVGRERVFASTDCGLGGRIHPQIAWAKLESLAQGAAIASSRLWK